MVYKDEPSWPHGVTDASGHPLGTVSCAIWRGNRCTLRLMRRTLALQCCLAFVTAFILAPFQHVHRGGDHHDRAPLIHSHLYGHHHDQHPHVDKPGEREIENADEDKATSLDTFTLVLAADFPPFVPSRA